MKDIGSIFGINELYYSKQDKKNSTLLENQLLLSLAREGISIVATQMENTAKKVLIPAYTCQTVITPFVEKNWTYKFYPIKKDLRISIAELVKMCDVSAPDLIVVHPFYGMELEEPEIECLRALHERGIKILQDKTQTIFGKDLDFSDYIIGSYRKWFPISDGAFLKMKKATNQFIFDALKENDYFVQTQLDAMFLREKYFETHDQNIKDISIRLNKLAVSSVANGITPHKMSEDSIIRMSHEDLINNVEKRDSNFRFLFNHVMTGNNIQHPYSIMPKNRFAPLYFPIYVTNRNSLQKELARNHVYAPILWGVNTMDVLINKETEEIYNQILAIPVDQRYDLADMQKVAEIINIWNK